MSNSNKKTNSLLECSSDFSASCYFQYSNSQRDDESFHEHRSEWSPIKFWVDGVMAGIVAGLFGTRHSVEKKMMGTNSTVHVNVFNTTTATSTTSE